MKQSHLILFLLLSVVAVNIFGFLAFGMMDHGAGKACPVMNFAVGKCPAGADLLGMTTHRLTGLKMLLLAIVSSQTFLAMAAIFLIISLRLVTTRANTYLRPDRFVILPRSSGPYREFFHWLALHNKQDALSPYGCMA